jgi:hypothetical protein
MNLPAEYLRVRVGVRGILSNHQQVRMAAIISSSPRSVGVAANYFLGTVVASGWCKELKPV